MFKKQYPKASVRKIKISKNGKTASYKFGSGRTAHFKLGNGWEFVSEN